MAVINEDEGNRKRKAHKKSRQGCRNCKLRRVKCDETRPRCTKCTSFGVACNYDPKAADLEMAFHGTFSIKRKEPVKLLPSTEEDFLGVVEFPENGFSIIEAPASPYPTIYSHDNTTFQFDRETWDRLLRFQNRTVLSVGTTRTAEIYRTEIPKLACSQPYLMHIIQTVTAIHDRFLTGPFTSQPTITEVHHWTRAASLFNAKLSTTPITHPDDKDSLWATAALLGIVAFSTDATCASSAWPLKSDETSDLDWLRMSAGKASVWRIAEPLRPGSIFAPLADEYNSFTRAYAANAASRGGLQCTAGIPSAFIKLYELDESLPVEENPYYTTIHHVVPLVGTECTQTNVIPFLSFVGHMSAQFRVLLEGKDARALLLLAYWYAEVHTLWWIKRRAVLECQAICFYLERYHADDEGIMDLLCFPKEEMKGLVGVC